MILTRFDFKNSLAESIQVFLFKTCITRLFCLESFKEGVSPYD
jgi:hypothetical protein